MYNLKQQSSKQRTLNLQIFSARLLFRQSLVTFVYKHFQYGAEISSFTKCYYVIFQIENTYLQAYVKKQRMPYLNLTLS